MPGNVDRIILLRRYTSFVSDQSGGDFIGSPIPAQAYTSANIVVWKRSVGSGTITFKLQISNDLVHWADFATLAAGGDQDLSTAVEGLETAWVRLKVTVSSHARFSVWAIGYFLRRSDAS